MRLLKMVGAIIALFTMLFVFGFGGVSAVSAKTCSLNETPLPKDLSIKPLTDSIPSNMAQFHGVWSNGAWGEGSLCTTLVVTKITANGNAKVIYSVGKTSDVSQRFWKIKAKIRNGKLSFWLKRTKLEYRLGEGGTILGVYQNPYSGSWKVTLEKIESP